MIVARFSIMLRFVPPAGTPVKIGDLASALYCAFRGDGDSERTTVHFLNFFAVDHVFLASSGRAALAVLLQALHSLHPERNVVAIPAYTCYSVPAAVVRAGLKLYPVDVVPETLDYDLGALEALPDANLLCVLTSNLFGLPSDAESVVRIARAKGAFMVDDAAQAMGARRNGILVGTRGDAGLFSLARGKALAAGGGGLVVTNNNMVAAAMQARLQMLPAASFVRAAGAFLESLAISLLLYPRLYWLPNRLPVLKLGVTTFDPGFPIGTMNNFARALMGRLVAGLDDLNHVRQANARRLLSLLPEGTAFYSPRPAADASPVYLRVPFLASNNAIRERALARLVAAGIGASLYYPAAVCDIPGIGPHLAAPDLHAPSAEDVARRILTLPTHVLVQPRDVERMVAILIASSADAAVLPGASADHEKTPVPGRQS